MKDKVIIFGVLRGKDYPLEAPINDPSYEVWCMNGSWEPERWDCWFQLHGIEHMMEVHGIKYIRWLQAVARYQASGGSVFVFADELHHFEGAKPFPMAELLKEFPESYFTGSFAYLIALAMLQGKKEIWINAGEMGKEVWALPCIEYYLGIARERHILCVADRASGIMDRRGGLYGLTAELGGNGLPGSVSSRLAD